MIVSATPGRVRFRNSAITGSSFSSSVESRLKQKKGISKVTVNKNSGSILVEYDTASYSIDQVGELIRESLSLPAVQSSPTNSSHIGNFLGAFSSVGKRPGKQMRNSLNSGLIASLLISMLAIVGDNKKLHIQAGLAFLVLVTKHTFDNKKRIWR